MTSGGGTGKHAKETLDKLSKALKGKKCSTETRHRISQSKRGKNHPWFGKKNPKHSEAMKGENNPNYGKSLSEETKQKISNSAKGRRHSKETCNKMSESRKGKKHSEETKRKISQSHKGKKQSSEHIKNQAAAHRLPEYNQAKWFFLYLFNHLPIQEKRKQLYLNFPQIPKNTIRSWVRKWNAL